MADEFVVRFTPSGYVPPHRVSHDLTERQRRILHVLGDGATLRSGEIRPQLDPMPSATVLRDELNLLRSLNLIEGPGYGAGAKWWLKHLRSSELQADLLDSHPWWLRSALFVFFVPLWFIKVRS
jgi:hypothetical protein